jgi:hypothetical protein
MDSGTIELTFAYMNTNENIQLKKAAAVMLMRYIKDYWVSF